MIVSGHFNPRQQMLCHLLSPYVHLKSEEIANKSFLAMYRREVTVKLDAGVSLEERQGKG